MTFDGRRSMCSGRLGDEATAAGSGMKLGVDDSRARLNEVSIVALSTEEYCATCLEATSTCVFDCTCTNVTSYMTN